MTFKVIRLRLSQEQIAQIDTAVTGGESYCLLAEPHMDRGVLDVQICTDEQFEILRPAIMEANRLPQWSKWKKKRD
jgi:hypothetical protein